MNGATYSMTTWLDALQQADDDLAAEGITKDSPEWVREFDRRWQEIVRATKEQQPNE